MRLTFLCRLAMLGSVFDRLAEICVTMHALSAQHSHGPRRQRLVKQAPTGVKLVHGEGI